VDSLLEFRRLEYSQITQGNLLWKPGEPKGWLQNMTDNRAQWAAYSTQPIQPVLLRYAELLRLIEGIPSGIAGTPGLGLEPRPTRYVPLCAGRPAGGEV
jgi:hypothetical protein